MRSQAILRRSFLKASATPSSALSSVPRLRRVSRKEQPPTRPPARVYRRLASSTPTTPQTEHLPLADASPPDEPPSEDANQTQASVKASVSSPPSKDPEDRPQLPSDLDILWVPESDSSETDPIESSALPPPEIFDEALTNLLITLHPQTQHRASYISPAGAPLEPTLSLYCPLEGGDYVIDETVKELARKTGSEVLVIDAVQLAAGEWGHFGKAANALQLPRNPLHFPSPASPSARAHPRFLVDEDDDGDSMPQMAIPSQMTLHVLAPTPSRGRTALLSTSRNTAAPSRVKTFFDELINIPAPTSDTGEKAIRSRRPRLIYLRDFPTLAPTSSTWYPPLLSAVRQRRVGPIARPSSPISNPMTIIFGITPPIVPPASVPSSSGSSNQGLVNMLMNRKPTSSVTPSNSRPSRSDWSEDETADKAREKRLKDRLRKWEKGDPELIDELPKLSVRGSEGESTNGKRPGVFVIGGSPGGGLPPSLDSILGGSENPNNSSDSEASTARFFRTSVLVPNTRSVAHERLCRTSRRREINEVTMRMGVGAVGGALHKMDTSCIEDKEGVPEGEQEPTTKDKDEEDMWHDWSNKVEVWSNVRQIADRALGSVVAATPNHHRTTKSNLEPTVVPWSAVHRAWAMQRSSHDLRKSWMKEAVTKVPRDKETEDQHDEGEAETGQESVDEVVERIKQDPDLEQHEQRLLACIVDAASMSTSFSQVHLPPHTIDSVRTIVSLPLLHPAAFQQGILKEHGMTGCLLFGPPGTGKTLVVRALAKEAGCRMMTISPSDVMDMYVGEGEKLVRAVFSLARRLSPCVVFLDEIDALFGARMSARESGGAFAHRGVITEFMQEMDGLKTSKDDRVIVIGATNRPFDLDDAVLRRLPRRLLVDLPGEKEREEILRILLREETLSTEVDLNALAKRTESFSGSDLKHLCVSAALDAVKEHVEVPWKSSSTLSGDQVPSLSTVLKSEDPSPAPSSSTTQPEDVASEPSTTSPIVPLRTLHLRHFTKALKEITPSSSESLGSLSDLRKWNEEFGEGRKDKKRQQVWGKGKFGFINKTNTSVDEGRVAVSSPTSATSTRDIV